METIPILIQRKLSAALPPGADVQPNAVPATNRQFGDYQTNVAMVLANRLGANPRQIAQQIIEELDVAEMCETPTVAGAGFVNFRLKTAWTAERLRKLAGDPHLGVPRPEKPLRIVIDFSSPNVAKPMHVGHIRSTILGDALARVAEFLGHSVVRDNHIGDWGTQFGMLLVGWKTLLDREALAAEPLAELERIYKLISPQCDEAKPEFNPATLAAARAELVKLQSGDKENLAIWQEMLRLSQDEFAEIYRRLGVRFDVTFGESFYNPWLNDVVQQLRKRNIAVESEGAWCVFSDGAVSQKDDPFFGRDKETGEWKPTPAIVQKADGAANYTTTDLATIEYRVKTWSSDLVIYVTDARQQKHFAQLFAIFRRWHPEATVRLVHVWFGAILGEDKKPIKTRSGDSVKLTALLDEAEERAYNLVTEKSPALPETDRREIARIVGLSAVKYFDLLPSREKDYVFSWDKMLSLQGNTAPYLQNAYVRIQSIFRKAEEAGIRSQESGVGSQELVLTEPAELTLAKKILQFGEVVPQVLEDFRPNLLCNYLYELATDFHAFYETCPVLKSEGDSRATRLALCRVSASVLQKGLDLLGIRVPERM